MLAKALFADLRDVFLRDDDADAGGGRAVERHEIGPGPFEPETHRERIDDVDLADARLELLGARPLVALEAELHVLAGDGIAVVELEPPAELELVGEPVRALRPRLRQAVAHLLVRHRAHESIVDRVDRAEGCDLRRRRRRIEPGRGDRDVPGYDDFSGRRGLGEGTPGDAER